MEGAAGWAAVAAHGLDDLGLGERARVEVGAIDDLHFAISPVLLGAGERLFDDDLGDATERYECVEATAGEGAMHYRLRRRA